MDTIKIWPLLGPEDEDPSEPLVHLVIDPAYGALCDPTEPATSSSNIHKVTCTRCRRIWLTGSAEP